MSIATTARPRSGRLAGTGLLVRLDLRRDRILAPAWTAVLVLMSLVSAAATPGLYPSQAMLVKAATAINESPAIVVLYGPILDPASVGEVAMTKMTVLYSVFAAVLFVVVVRRHTRVEEESGRTELVGGAAVGRDAPLAAALVEALVLALAIGLLTALANTVGGLDAVGSVAFGALWAGTGLVAAGIAAVCAQLSASARTCAYFAAATIGVLFTLRAVGDTGPGWLSWLSPFGWNTQVRAYSDTRWWLLLAYPLLAVALVATAVALRSRRDLGSGLVAARPGPEVGSPRLSDAFALAVEVHRATIVLWTAAVGALGVVFGMVAPGMGDLIESLDSSAVQSFIERLGGMLIAAILSIVAVQISYFGVTVIAHTGKDEAEGRTELVLATATSRSRWFAASAVVAVVGVTWLLLVTGIGLSIGYAAASGPPLDSLVIAALAWAPAVWVTVALAALCFALRAAWTVLGWVWPAGFLVLDLFGELLTWPDRALDVSPYNHVPQLPAQSWEWTPEVGLTVVAAALLALAWWRFRARDIG